MWQSAIYWLGLGAAIGVISKLIPKVDLDDVLYLWDSKKTIPNLGEWQKEC